MDNHSKNNHHHKNNNSADNHHKMMIKDFQKRFWISTIITIPILILSPEIQAFFKWSLKFPGDILTLFLLSSFIYFYGGWPFLKGMKTELKKKQPGMMTLITVAITAAYAYSSAVIFFIKGETFFWELATLVDIMLVGHWIEMSATMAASRALEKLAKLLPSNAHLVLDDGTIKEIRLNELKLNDKVLVKPGEKIPVDGKIIEGKSHINESMLTGESKPVSKKSGESVIAGSINEDGAVTVVVEKTGENSYLYQIIQLVKTASQSKSKAQTIANIAAYWLTIVAISVGLLTFLIWLLINPGNFNFALERMVTVMVITCPHALGLAVPLVVSVITTLAAQNGLLIRKRTSFEIAKNMQVIMFDKTGTLTTGEFGVSNIVTLGDWKEEELLKKTAAIERNSEHSIAASIVKKAKEKNIILPKVEDFKAFSGKGVTGKVDGTEIFVGNRMIFEQTNIPQEEKQLALKKLEELENQGQTVIIITTKNKVVGLMALSDIIRKVSKEACTDLKKFGYQIAMITGDNQQIADQVAKELGIDIVFAQVLPDQKAEKVKILQQKGKTVAMVGDGINDAPALAQADVGIAIGAGTDIAVETADIILTKNDPRNVVDIITLSKLSHRKMIQNLAWATGYNVIAIPLAAGIFHNWGLMLHPAVAALVMSLSTVIVAINSRLIHFDHK